MSILTVRRTFDHKGSDGIYDGSHTILTDTDIFVIDCSVRPRLVNRWGYFSLRFHLLLHITSQKNDTIVLVHSFISVSPNYLSHVNSCLAFSNISPAVRGTWVGSPWMIHHDLDRKQHNQMRTIVALIDIHHWFQTVPCIIVMTIHLSHNLN